MNKRSRSSNCNQKHTDNEYKLFIDIVIQNLKGYDSHHIFRWINNRVVTMFDEKHGQSSKENVEIIALNLERFVSFEMLYLRFIDSCQFLNASLEALVDSLVKSCDEPFDKFKHSRLHMGSNELLFA
jgi:hypothetical protein